MHVKKMGEHVAVLLILKFCKSSIKPNKPTGDLFRLIQASRKGAHFKSQKLMKTQTDFFPKILQTTDKK